MRLIQSILKLGSIKTSVPLRSVENTYSFGVIVSKLYVAFDGISGSFIFREDGFYLLREDGTKFIREEYAG